MRDDGDTDPGRCPEADPRRVGTWRTSHQISTLRGRCSSVVRAPIAAALGALCGWLTVAVLLWRVRARQSACYSSGNPALRGRRIMSGRRTGLGSVASSYVFSDARVEPRPKRVPRPGRATTRRSPLCPLRAGAEGRGQGARPLLTLCRPSARSIKPGLGSPSGPSPVCRAAFGISSSKPGAAPSLARPPSLPRTSSIVRTGPWRGFPFGSDSRGLS